MGIPDWMLLVAAMTWAAIGLATMFVWFIKDGLSKWRQHEIAVMDQWMRIGIACTVSPIVFIVATVVLAPVPRVMEVVDACLMFALLLYVVLRVNDLCRLRHKKFERAY